MKRSRVKARKDKRIFSRTANKTKAVNVKPQFARGGICLR